MRNAVLAALTLTLATCPAIAGRWSQQKDEAIKVEAFIESIGVPVMWADHNHDKCSTEDGYLLGFYQYSKERVVMCPAVLSGRSAGPRITLKHEGWHAIQHKCTGMKPTLNDNQIRSRLSKSDKKNLRKFYKPSQHRAEAEARAVERLPTDVWLRGSKKVCASLLKSLNR